MLTSNSYWFCSFFPLLSLNSEVPLHNGMTVLLIALTRLAGSATGLGGESDRAPWKRGPLPRERKSWAQKSWVCRNRHLGALVWQPCQPPVFDTDKTHSLFQHDIDTCKLWKTEWNLKKRRHWVQELIMHSGYDVIMVVYVSVHALW